jgi:hypothetical protein
MMKRSAILCSLGVLLSIGTMSGVSSGSAATDRGGSVPRGLIGTWGKSIPLATWTRHHIRGQTGGHYAIYIGASGLTSLYDGNDPTMATMTFPFTTMQAFISGDVITIGPTADGACQGNGTYRWVVSASRLTFTAITDGCDPRKVLLTTGTFAREH